jgi:hypothetical protein
VIFDVFLAGFTKEKPPVALTESDLSELLAALKAGGDDRHDPLLAGVDPAAVDRGRSDLGDRRRPA